MFENGRLTRSAEDIESFFELTSREVDDETLNIDLNDATGVFFVASAVLFDVVDVNEEFSVALLPRSVTSDDSVSS